MNEKPLKPADIADLFNQSLAWVSKNYKKLGGIKIGGRMFFPPKEKLYERLFGGEEGLAIRLHEEGREIHTSILQDETGSREGGAKGKRPPRKTSIDRHGLFRPS